METKPQIKFSLLEKLEFYDDPEMKRFKKIFPKVQKEDIRPFVQCKYIIFTVQIQQTVF